LLRGDLLLDLARGLARCVGRYPIDDLNTLALNSSTPAAGESEDR
jgi:hypothetical protein